MEKGILIVTKKGGAKVKRADGKETNIVTKYDYSAYIPDSGKARINCEYEANDKKQAVRVFVNGKELPKDTVAAQKKEERIARQKAEEARKLAVAVAAKRNAEQEKKFGKDSFDIAKAFCPQDTASIDIKAYEVENFALKLNKFARFVENERDYSKSKFEFFKSGRRGPEYQIQPNYDKIDFKGLVNRNLNSAKTLLGSHCVDFCKTTNGRLIAGLGGASVYETNITLHHIYGFPYLPASSIKGVVRSWIIQNIFSKNGNGEIDLKKAEERALKSATNDSKAFCKIFGCPKNSVLKKEQQGKIFFFDAFPTTAPEIVPDIMNPHYGPYYNGEELPADYHSPIPIFFLTVDKKTEFQFIIGSKDANWLKDDYKIGDNTIEWWLKDALQNYGIGAKTAVGYGYFS